VILVTHPTPTMIKDWYEDWVNGEGAIERKKIAFWLDSQKKNRQSYTLRITDMPYDVPNEI